jgi:hypothetical protein
MPHPTQNRCNCATPQATWELNGGIRVATLAVL